MNPQWIVTGLARSRTAWLGALLATPKVPVYHDVMTYPPEGDLYAIADPSIATFESFHGIADGVPTVVVVRDVDQSFAAFAKAFDIEVDRRFRERMIKAFNGFCTNRPAMFVRYEALDNDQAVQAISEYLIGKSLDPRRLRTFQALNITEHVPKARARLAHPELRVVH